MVQWEMLAYPMIHLHSLLYARGVALSPQSCNLSFSNVFQRICSDPSRSLDSKRNAPWWPGSSHELLVVYCLYVLAGHARYAPCHAPAGMPRQPLSRPGFWSCSRLGQGASEDLRHNLNPASIRTLARPQRPHHHHRLEAIHPPQRFHTSKIVPFWRPIIALCANRQM